jgi:phosphatidylserine decarboxylase
MVPDKIRKTRIENRLPVAREGLPFILAGTVLTVLSALSGRPAVFIFFLVLTSFVIYFFRDPERVPDEQGDAVLSPADGRVIKAGPLEGSDNPYGGPCIEVCIFMSIFNVHVNRAVASGVIEDVKYTPGRFVAANLDKASEQNERNRITITTADGRTIVVVQVAGLIARRIACWVRPGDTVEAGRRFGLIRFGSRLDVYLPEGSRLKVGTGMRVSAGKSVIGRLG